ncbi:MAG: hypothetical protein RL247_549 [Actinomycetota bacterium]|jgi:cytochrome oxidase assembly protein ShyY1
MLGVFFTKRWLGYFALTIVFAIIASLFGQWQWDRRGQAVAAIDRVENNFDREPVPLEQFLSENPIVDRDDEWVPVTVSGRYLAGEQILVRTRPRSGAVGFEVLVPLETTDGIFIINRGWISTGDSSDLPDVIPEAPDGIVSLVARVRPGEPELQGRGAPEGQIASIHLPTIAQITERELRDDFYLALGSEQPSVAPSPLPLERPQLDEGPHLSYTFQWYLFALMAIIGFLYMLKQEVALQRGDKRKERVGSTDAEEEDALLDKRAG